MLSKSRSTCVDSRGAQGGEEGREMGEGRGEGKKNKKIDKRKKKDKKRRDLVVKNVYSAERSYCHLGRVCLVRGVVRHS